MKKILPWIFGILAAAFVAFVGLFIFCIPVNAHSPAFLILCSIVVFAGIFFVRLFLGNTDFGWQITYKKTGSKGRKKTIRKFNFNLKYYIFPIAMLAVILIIAISGSTFFNATEYSSILQVKNSDFSQDLAESLGTDSIALMDTASAQMLGDREIGSLSDVVSQFDVATNYTQIDYNGKPIKVAALVYADFFKWINNRDTGIKGYVTVNPVSMSASFETSSGMKFVPSAYLLEDARRHIWLQYPTLIIDNLHFEIDESGKPYYICSIVDKTISLFGGKTIKGCIALDPVTGETYKYDVSNTPRWIDVVFHGDLICEQYNWLGMYSNGFLNSLFAKKDCKQVTTYYTSEEDTEDVVPVTDFGYIAKDGDIWIYTGITSVNGDSSNIGFLLANERTGESRYYSIAGADEKSAMSAAEGEVQEKGYQASFPSLINIDGNPTYIMVLKDSGGLVKLYAAVNVEQYNIVTTAPTQSECITQYKSLLGIDTSNAPSQAELKAQITISDIKYIDIDGNTYIYIIDTQNNIYKAKASSNEEMLLLKVGDSISITHTDKKLITAFKK
ncbi:MAG: hypothetical protein IIX14_02890 [Clostridia bacterium]|nr:hypothetical protein [Clostridia bacterium]